jgi:hypothetical protein
MHHALPARITCGRSRRLVAKNTCAAKAWLLHRLAHRLAGGLGAAADRLPSAAMSLCSLAAAQAWALHRPLPCAQTVPSLLLTCVNPSRRDRPQVLLRHGQTHARWQAAGKDIDNCAPKLSNVGWN